MHDSDLWDASSIVDAAGCDNRVLIVGAGKMGAAILQGLANVFKAGLITVCEPDEAQRADISRRFPGITVLASLNQIDDHTYGSDDWIVLAVKPQIIGSVLDDVNRIGLQATVISVAVGIPLAFFAEALPLAGIIRIMPNLPVMIGEGMILITASDRTPTEVVDAVAEAFTELGDVAYVEENQIDVGAAISGSGPAYFALVVSALEQAGIAAGLSASLARDLANTTMMGTADMIDMTGEDPLVIAQAVQSPGGTTQRAVAVLEDSGLTSMFKSAVDAAIARAHELADQTNDADL